MTRGNPRGVIRREDWPERLIAFVDSRIDAPFVWGQNDCALFVADAVLTMTGFDFAIEFRGRYTTALGALKALRSNGASDLADYVSQVLGEPMAPALARRGDVVLFEAVEGPALGVVINRAAAAAGPQGVAWIPLVAWVRAWRVA